MEERVIRKRESRRPGRARSGPRIYLFVGLAGAAAGSWFTLKVTRALPRMMSRMMCTMMENLAAQQGVEGLSRDEL